MVLVDTSVWSLALRRKRPAAGEVVETLARLVHEDRARMIGAVRQELLTGVSDPDVFERLARALNAYPDLPMDASDYVRAASFCNLCRCRGVQGSNTDYLLCAAAARHEIPIYTTDRDFQNFSAHLPIRLFGLPQDQ